MPSDKAAYLAAHYLTVDKKPSKSKSKPTSKKRKRTKTSSSAKNNDGLLITEDDELGWSTKNSSDDDKDEDGDTPMTAVVAGTSAEFRRAKKSSWKTVGAPITPAADTKDTRDAAAQADAIIASAAAETAAAAREADGDDAPVVDQQDEEEAEVPMMADGTRAGLQSAAELTAQLKRRQKAEREELARLRAAAAAKDGGGKDEPELVLRDATGRRVDVSMRRAEARREAEVAARAEEDKKRALKGEVQLEQARQRREMLEEAKLMPLARRADDEEMNREMKSERRWNDPMARFLDDDDGGGGGSKKSSTNKRRPVYKGPAPPNRYGIRPGYRWDGVDRSNGFEAERFKAINRRERNKGLDYAWQMDE